MTPNHPPVVSQRVAQQRARYVRDHRAVVVVDEASMANTHDLERLVVTAGRVGAKVVLVGDPAQIGVVRGPGGMLAALANAGHGLDLHAVHRFDENWEADASLELRRGNPGVLETYRERERVHAHDDASEAVEALHARWTAERAAGNEVLIMARTRADVDALNNRARESALDTGEVHGQAVRLGERDWQTGDLLRARRNDRTLAVGEDGHVRNGDRYRVLAVDESGLRVEHLDRGEETFLPAAYVAVHGEYGWATTVTAAQGATVDVGLVLVRSGIDREHLYVAMTRGRVANHAFVAGETAAEGHGAPVADTGFGGAPEDWALDVLAGALARTGAQDAAHTVREWARLRVYVDARVTAERDGSRDAVAALAPARRPVDPAQRVDYTLRRTQDALRRLSAADRRRAEADRLMGADDRWILDHHRRYPQPVDTPDHGRSRGIDI